MYFADFLLLSNILAPKPIVLPEIDLMGNINLDL